MASVKISTHIFKQIGNLSLKINLYRRPQISDSIDSKTPVVLFLHGGGLVAYHRDTLPPHVVQMSLLRGWPLVSADYRLLPQVKGKDIIEDVKHAYTFVRTQLSSILIDDTSKEFIFENIILVGQSAGAHLAYMGGIYFEPPPLAILTYYGWSTVDAPDLNKKLLQHETIKSSKIQRYYDEAENVGISESSTSFDPTSLNMDLSRNVDFVAPDPILDSRVPVIGWIIQHEGLLSHFEDVHRDLSDDAWRNFPETVMIHGDQDTAVPFDRSEQLLDVIGPRRPKLFVAKGHGHIFDFPLLLGDKDFEPIEAAWKSLDDIVDRKAR